MPKTIFFKIFLTLLLCYFNNLLFCQSSFSLTALVNKTITTQTEVKTSNNVTIVQGGSISKSNEDKMNRIDRRTWSTTIKMGNSNTISVTKTLKRVMFEMNAPYIGLKKYDSDNSFEADNMAANFVSTELDFIDKPTTRNFDSNGNLIQTVSNQNNADSIWLNYLPQFNQSRFLNGLIFMPSLPSNHALNSSWKDSFVVSADTIINSYVLSAIRSDTATITFNSTKLLHKSGSNAATAGGMSMDLSTENIRALYEGFVNINLSTGEIDFLKCKTTEESIYTMNNEKTPKIHNFEMTLTNTISSYKKGK